MAIFKPYHRRMQEQRGEIPETFHYDINITERAKIYVLLSHIINEELSEETYKLLSREFPEIITSYPNYFSEIIKLMENSTDEIFLSIIEYFLFVALELSVRPKRYTYLETRMSLVNKINERFQYERIGYKFTDEGLCIKIEDETFYEECTSRTLGVLSNAHYHDVVAYYMDSYAKVSSKEYDDALVEIGRALETLLKTRFHVLGIAYNEKDTLNTLLNIAKVHIPVDADFDFKYFQDMILHIGRQRNQRGAHGPTQGNAPAMNEVYVRFVINQAAAALLFLAEVDMVK